MWPSDLDYGIFGFTFDGEPSGGKIKTKPEDFVVVEVDPETREPIPIPPEPVEYNFNSGGLFLVGRVWRKNHDHSRMIRLMAKQFGVPEKNISTSGIKDAFAEIIQLFSIYNPSKEVSDPTMLDLGIEIDSFQYAKERIYPGSMGGNYFQITIRESNQIYHENLDYFGSWLDQGLLNYYGYQRFGSGRPITASFGRALANKNYKKAVEIFLGGKSSREDEIYRKHWRDNQDPDELLLIWDDVPLIERQMLNKLSQRSNDYRAAISKVPDFLINISLSAFVSLLTNNYFSRRGLSDELLPGERNSNNNIEVALPSNRWTKPLNIIWEEVFDYLEVELKELKNIRHTSRMLKMFPKKWNYEILTEDKLKIKFQLENGEYATTLLRELMQEPPDAYF